MNIYKNIPDEIKYKIDTIIKSNIKIYVKECILKELEVFHKFRLKKIFFDYYRKMNQIYKNINFRDYNMILKDILFFLNHPYSQNMDTPFLNGRFTDKFIYIMKQINKNINEIIERWYNCYYIKSIYDDYQLEEYLITIMLSNYKHYSKSFKDNTIYSQSLYNRNLHYNLFQEKNTITINFIYDILDNLSITELENLYIYMMKQIGYCNKKYILENTLSFYDCQLKIDL